MTVYLLSLEVFLSRKIGYKCVCVVPIADKNIIIFFGYIIVVFKILYDYLPNEDVDAKYDFPKINKAKLNNYLPFGVA